MRIRFLQFVIRYVMLGAVAAPSGARAEDEMALASKEDSIVAMINDEVVEVGEYRLVMQRNTAEVFAWFKEHRNLEDHPGYWEDRGAEEAPIAMLRELTLRELAQIKICQTLAREYGLLKDTSFRTFQAEFRKENERRRAAAESGAVVYGPKQYREAAYYYIRHGDLLFRVKKVLAKEAEPEITDQMISDYLKANKASFEGKPEAEVAQKIRSILSEREAEIQFRALQEGARIKVWEEAIKGILPRVDT